MRLLRPLLLQLLVPLLLVPLGSSVAASAQGSTAPIASPEGLVFETLGGATQRVPLEGLDLADPRERGAWSVRVEGFETPGPDPAETGGRRVQVRLHGGEELRGRIVGGQGEVLSIELLGGVRLPLEVERIHRVFLPEQVASLQLVPLEAPSEGDRLYRRTQAALDAIDGTLDSFTPGGVSFESDEVGRKTFSWEEIAALYVEYLGDEGAVAPTPAVPVVVDLADRSRVRGALERMSTESCRVQVGGHVLELPWPAVSEITVVDGRVRFLSSLAPEREVGCGVPFEDELGMSWPHRMDANAFDGGPLRSGGEAWRRGIGMHAPSKLYFPLKDDYRELVGYCAIDDGALRNPRRARGAVVFRLHLDGEIAWESGLVRGGDEPVELPRLRLSGKKELVLEVDPAGSHAGDRANWLRMALIR